MTKKCCSPKKIILSGTLLFYVFVLTAQSNTLLKYYTKDWIPVQQDSAFYYTEFEKIKNHFKSTSYFYKSNKIRSIGFFTDTLFTKQVGLLKRFYETGVLLDSVLVSDDGDIEEDYHYYPNGKLWSYGYFNKKSKKDKSKGYDEKGNEIPDFIAGREAKHPDGDNGWINYISEHINVKIPGKNNAPIGNYTVIIKFAVDTDGKLIDIEPETNIGYGMEKELMRVIKKSVKWIPAIQYNLPVKAYRRQPLTFAVQ